MRKLTFSPQFRKQIHRTISTLGLLLGLTSVAHAQAQSWGIVQS